MVTKMVTPNQPKISRRVSHKLRVQVLAIFLFWSADTINSREDTVKVLFCSRVIVFYSSGEILIYNVWKQVLEYFDSFQIGLTATPDKRTFQLLHDTVDYTDCTP